jgi:hypothetical protein
MKEDRLQEYLTRKQRKRMEEDPAFREEFLRADWGEGFIRVAAAFSLVTIISWLLYGYDDDMTQLTLLMDVVAGGVYGTAWIYELRWQRHHSN